MSRRSNRAKVARVRARYRALSKRITIGQIGAFDLNLVPVAYGLGTCWLYPSGSKATYASLSHNGHSVQAHRFALAVKLNCTLWDLDGFDAAHAPVDICMGGRCCHPDHLFKKTPPKNRSFDRVGTGLNGPRKARPELVPLMYPVGVYQDGTMFDEPWQSNASPALLRFLEMGMKDSLLEMQKTAFGPHRERL